MMIAAFVTILLSAFCLSSAVGQEARHECEVFKYSWYGEASSDDPMGQMAQSFAHFIDDVCSKNPGMPALRKMMDKVQFDYRRESEFPNVTSVLDQLWSDHNSYLEILGVRIDTQRKPHEMDNTVYVGELLYPSDYEGPKNKTLLIEHFKLESGNYHRLIQTHFLLILYLLAMDIQQTDSNNPTELAQHQAIIIALLAAAHERIPAEKQGVDQSLLDLYHLVDTALERERAKHPEPK